MTKLLKLFCILGVLLALLFVVGLVIIVAILYKPEKPMVINGQKVDIIVDQHAHGPYKNVSSAMIKALPGYLIFVKAGIYDENFNVRRRDIMVVGAGKEVTKIRYNASQSDGYPAERTATLGVYGENFVAEHITFENTANPSDGYGLAVFNMGINSTFYKCGFVGYKNVVYVASGPQLYKECDINGTVDTVIGDGRALFQTCYWYNGEPLLGDDITLAVQGRNVLMSKTGFVFQDCHLPAEPSSSPITLARASGYYARVVVMESSVNAPIGPDTWLGISKNDHHFYGVFNNVPTKEYEVPGVQVLRMEDAKKFTPKDFISAESWVPSFINYSSSFVKT